MLKIDCEGSEYAIFAALKPEDMDRIKSLTIELHDVPGHDRREILDFLGQQGYVLSGINPITAKKPA